MSCGRLPFTKIKKKERNFFPLRRCQGCPRKWKGVEKVGTTGMGVEDMKVVRVMSCKDTCAYLRLGEVNE